MEVIIEADPTTSAFDFEAVDVFRSKGDRLWLNEFTVFGATVTGNVPDTPVMLIDLPSSQLRPSGVLRYFGPKGVQNGTGLLIEGQNSHVVFDSPLYLGSFMLDLNMSALKSICLRTKFGENYVFSKAIFRLSVTK